MGLRFTISLLGMAVACTTSAQVLAEDDDVQASENSANLEVMIDPETGEMTSDPTARRAQKTAPLDIEQPDVVMTEMPNGATKIELNDRFIRPLEVSIDENGNITNEGHSELKRVEAER